MYLVNESEGNKKMTSKFIQNHISDLMRAFLEYRDQGQWDKLALLMAEEAYVDDEIITEAKAGHKPSSSILYTWRNMLRSLYYGAKHKMVGAKVERLGRKEVAAESEVEARYYTMRGNTRHVMVVKGIYNYTFKKVAGKWRISDIRFSLLERSLIPMGA
jgi:hypothetical protein